jgi:hypothetical protein
VVSATGLKRSLVVAASTMNEQTHRVSSFAPCTLPHRRCEKKQVTCENCGGRGWYWAPVSAHDLVREKCDHCNGQGWHWRREGRLP